MPAALLSAMMLSGIVKEQGIAREKATFANYWFRHLWIPGVHCGFPVDMDPV